MLKFLCRLVLGPIIWITKFLLKCLAIVTVAICLFLLAGNFWLPGATKLAVQKFSGFSAEVGKSRGSIFRGRIDFKNLEIKSPKRSFDHREFVLFDRVLADIDMTSLFSDTVVIEEAVVDIGCVAIVKNSKGVKNYSMFVDNVSESIARSFPKKETSKEVSSSEDDKSVSIKTLILSLNTIRIVDEVGETDKEYRINYRREFKDVNDFSKLGAQVAADISRYGLPIILDSVVSFITGLPGSAIDGAVRVKDVSVKTVHKAVNVVGKAAGALGSGLKRIFAK